MSFEKLAKFIQNILVPLVTVGTASMVAWLNFSVSRIDQDLKARIAAVDIAVKEAREERERLSTERDFNFRIYDLVQKSLEEGNEKKQAVAKVFVTVMVDGDLRQGLLGVLASGGTPKIREEAARDIAQERQFDAEQTAIYTSARATPPSFNWEDWDYDLFWCSSSGPVAAEQATLVRERLLAEGARGRIRVRELPDSINAKLDYKIAGYAIRRNDNEISQAEALKRLAQEVLAQNNFPAELTIGGTSQQTPWYVSAFFCP